MCEVPHRACYRYCLAMPRSQVKSFDYWCTSLKYSTRTVIPLLCGQSRFMKRASALIWVSKRVAQSLDYGVSRGRGTHRGRRGRLIPQERIEEAADVTRAASVHYGAL